MLFDTLTYEGTLEYEDCESIKEHISENQENV